MLEENAQVARVNYPFLPGHEQHELAKKQFDGPTGLLSFELHGGADAAARVINRLKYFKIGVSWGGFESLVYSPGMSGKSEQFADRIRPPNGAFDPDFRRTRRYGKTYWKIAIGFGMGLRL